MSAPLSHRERAAALLLVLALASWMVWMRGSVMPPVWPFGDQLTYSLGDRPALVLLEPVLHAPWFGTTSAATAWVAAAFVLFSGLVAARSTGASLLSALSVLAVLAADRGFSSVVAHGGWSVVSIGLAWMATALAFGNRGDDPRRIGSMTMPTGAREALIVGTWAAAVWWSWLAVMAWPILFVGVKRARQRSIRIMAIVLSLVVGAVAVIAHFQAMASAAQSISYAPGLWLDWQDALVAAFDERPGVPADSYARPDVNGRLSALALLLVAVGGVTASPPSGGRRAVAVSVAAAVVLYFAFPVWREEILRYLMWGLVPLAAVGLTWCSRRTPGRKLAPVLALLLGAAMVAETAVADVRPIGGSSTGVFRDRFEDMLDRAGGQLALVAEDTRIDSAVAAWLGARPGETRLVPDGAVVADAVSEGRAVLAGAGARRQLELQGLAFATRMRLTAPAPYVLSAPASVYHCSLVRNDRWSLLPGLEYTGRLGIQIPPSLVGELRLIVGDMLPLRVRASFAHGEPFPMTVESLLAGTGVSTPPPDYWFERGVPERDNENVALLRLEPHPAATRLLSLHLGRRAPRVLARLDGVNAAARARICAAPIGEALVRGDEESEVVVPLTSEAYFGTGWYGLEGRGADRFRWMNRDGVVLIPAAARSAVRVALVAASGTVPAGGTESGQTLTLHVNGVEFDTVPTNGQMQRYEWDVPATVWLAGTNELWFHTSRAVRPADTGGEDTRRLAMAVKAIAIRPEP